MTQSASSASFSLGASASASQTPTIPGWEHRSSGKVRDVYAPTSDGPWGGQDVLLVVASDRISAYDHILSTPIPDKGRVLTALSAWWFEQLADVVPGHCVARRAHHWTPARLPRHDAHSSGSARRWEPGCDRSKSHRRDGSGSHLPPLPDLPDRTLTWVNTDAGGHGAPLPATPRENITNR